VNKSKESVKIFLDHCMSGQWLLAQNSFHIVFLENTFEENEKEIWLKILKQIENSLNPKKLDITKKWYYYFSHKKWGKSFIIQLQNMIVDSSGKIHLQGDHPSELGELPLNVLKGLALNYWEQGELAKAKIHFQHLVENPFIFTDSNLAEIDKIFEIAQYIDDFLLTQKILIHLIDYGDSQVFMPFYNLFYYSS
jgi:hypothetical protein